jgi:hypothetical protein
MDQAADFGQGLRLVAAAVISAVVTAASVIVVGETVIERRAHASNAPDVFLVRTGR